MALIANSLFLFNIDVTDSNKSIDFLNVSLGSEIQATLRLGFYSLTAILVEYKRAMEAADPANTYTVTADRTFNGGTENRVTILTSGSFLSILYATGTRNATSANAIIGFPNTDQTGSTTYTGTSSAGTTLIPTEIGYSFLPPQNWQKVFGSVNISASGIKETIVYDTQEFFQVEFKYEAQSRILTEWEPLWQWLMQQKLFDFTPEITAPTVFFEGTLDRSVGESKGLGYRMAEMLPNYPFKYTTGAMIFRLNET